MRILVALLFACPVCILAQTTAGTLFGVVRDTPRAGRPQVEVKATQTATYLARTATTDDDEKGEYLIINLPTGQSTGSIRVTVDATGVDTRSSTVGEVVDRVRVQELPLEGRNAVELARIGPGLARTSAQTEARLT